MQCECCPTKQEAATFTDLHAFGVYHTLSVYHNTVGELFSFPFKRVQRNMQRQPPFVQFKRQYTEIESYLQSYVCYLNSNR